MSKDVLFGREARAKLLEGINLVAEAVGRTIGPRGRNSILSRGTAPPVITNDGVSIARWFTTVEDPYVNTGLQMIKEVANKQNEPGDGTTTATILAAALVNEGERFIFAGIDQTVLREGIAQAAEATIEALKQSALPVKTKEDLVQIATISVEDEATGKIIGEMMHEVGMDGAIAIETASSPKLEKDISSGLKFEQGFMSPYFMTEPARQEALLGDVPIMVTDHTLSLNSHFTPLADQLLAQGTKRMVVICDDMKNDALVTAANNVVRGNFQFLVIRLPGFDEERTKVGEDIATAVGARFISKALDKIEEATLNDLGRAEQVLAKPDYTLIVKGAGSKESVSTRVKVLREEWKTAVSDFDRDQITERIARLSGGIGVIRIGAATEQELTYKKHKIEDALAATRAAQEEGIVAGGGVALLRLVQESTQPGEQVFYKAIQEPIRTIAKNAGKNPDTVVEKVLEGKGSVGFNAKTGTYTDLLKEGIVDPVKVTRKAIENAVSMALMYLSSDSLIVDLPENQKPREERLKEGR